MALAALVLAGCAASTSGGQGFAGPYVGVSGGAASASVDAPRP